MYGKQKRGVNRGASDPGDTLYLQHPLFQVRQDQNHQAQHVVVGVLQARAIDGPYLPVEAAMSWTANVDEQFEEMFRRHYKSMFRLARRVARCGDEDAEEIIQNAMLRRIKSPYDPNRGASYLTYLTTSIMSAASDWRRAKQRREAHEVAQNEETANNWGGEEAVSHSPYGQRKRALLYGSEIMEVMSEVEQLYPSGDEGLEARADLNKAWSRLSPQDQRLVKLLFVEGWTLEHYRKVYQEPTVQVVKRAAAAITTLRQALRDYNGGVVPAPPALRDLALLGGD